MPADQLDQIVQLRKKLEKHFKESTEIFPSFSVIKIIPTIPSRSTIINAVTGIGGFPRGRVTEVYGPESSGKTTFGIETICSLQKSNPDGVALFLDYEHAMDLRYARSLGMRLDEGSFILAQPESFEQGAVIVFQFLKEGLVDLIVIDSAAAMTPLAELEGEADGTTRIGLQATLMARFLGKLTKIIPRGRKPAVVILNQTRTKIDINNPRNTGEDAAGGRALKFYSSIRLQLEVVKKEGEANRGSKGMDQVFTQTRIRVTAVKNKLASPFIRAQLVIEFGKGINNIVSVAELAEAKLGIMSGAGYCKYVGDTPGTSFSLRGREAFLEYLKEHPETLREIETKLLHAIHLEHARELGLETLNKGTEVAKEIEEKDPIILEDPDFPLRAPLEEGTGLPLED